MNKLRKIIYILLPPIYFIIRNKLFGKPFNMGVGTYGKPTVIGKGELVIGNYCSIADNVTIVLYGHHTQDFSTYPFKFRKHPNAKEGKVIIGHDVWIGYGAIIIANSYIGNGAVIGAGSIVRGKIKPYSIVAGNPAEFVSMRFEQETIDFLQQSKWWNKPVKEIKQIQTPLN